MGRKQAVRQYFQALIDAWGPQDWWPARTRFEVIAGAYLTQNTAWINVERALRNLHRARALNAEGIRHLSLSELERLVRPAGYFRQKAQRLKTFVAYLDDRYGGSLKRMFAQPTEQLRTELLALNGVGPETADSILLYAGGHPVFVVDAYTRRIFERHGLLNGSEKYEEIRELVERAFATVAGSGWQEAGFQPKAPLDVRRRHKFTIASAPAKAKIFDEYHALMVQVAKHSCLKKVARCEECPLRRFLPQTGPLMVHREDLNRKKRPARRPA